MNRYWTLLVALSVTSPLLAQESAKTLPATVFPAGLDKNPVSLTSACDSCCQEESRGCLRSDTAFPGFIGYISNPAKAIDPRSLTQLLPIYDYVSLSPLTHTTRGVGPLPPRDITLVPAGQINIIGPALSLAITDRLNIGITSGGPALTSYPGRSSGWLDLGGYAQYTVIRDVPNQFLATLGMTWTAPSGSPSLFQGSPPVYLGAYGTVGKEFGNWHVLSTVGFEFPAGSGDVTRETFYGTVHLDRRCFGWLYPLVEFNWSAATTNFDLDRPFLSHLFRLDDFSANGSIVTVAPGVNAVLIPNRLELGVVYQTPIYSQHDTRFNSFLVKMVIRY